MKSYPSPELLQQARHRLEEIRKRPDPPVRRLEAVKISNDHGKTWTSRVLCMDCSRGVEPPTRVTRHGQTGAMYCEWCGARNER